MYPLGGGALAIFGVRLLFGNGGGVPLSGIAGIGVTPREGGSGAVTGIGVPYLDGGRGSSAGDSSPSVYAET